MNRAQRRLQVKNLQKKGVKRDIARNVVEKYYAESLILKEGQAVKLNVPFMKAHPDWKMQREDFKRWVLDHEGEIFHVEYDEKRAAKEKEDKQILVQLKEDTTEPKWLFFTSTLTPIASATVNIDDGEKIEVPLEGVTDANDPSIMEKVNEAINSEDLGEN